jgi:type I restriction enzyme, S subunit
MEVMAKCIHEVCSITSSKRIYKADYQPEGIPFYRAKEISEKHNGKELSDRLFISRDKFETLKKKFGVPQDGDLLLTSIGALLGEPYVVKNDGDFYFKDGNLTWFRDFRGLKSQYLYYWLISPQGKAQLQTAVIGSAQPAFTISALKNMSITLPTVFYQSKVVAILSAYDDLIENNQRRIKILEEMAQSLYREWFVNFRFPSHEKTRMVDSTIGKIPEGWDVVELIDSCELVMGQSPKSEFYNEQGDGLPFHQGVTHFGERFPTNCIYCTDMNRLAEESDILFSVRAPVGRINIAENRLIIGRGLAAIRSRSGHRWFTLHQLKERFKEEDTMGGGTIFKAVTKQEMEHIDFLRPKTENVSNFESVCDPMEKEIHNLTQRNRILRQCRDLLLPKLISGELDVSKLDIKIPEEAA